MVHVQTFTRDTLNTLLGLADRTNLSVYMPAQQTFPERTQNPIRLKNLIKDLEGLLADQAQAETLLAPFHDLVADTEFWNSCPPSIAIFGGAEHFLVVGLHRPVQETAIVNRHPYLRPLLRQAPMTERYQALCLTRDSVRVYEGAAQTLQQVELPEAVPTSQADALGDQLTSRDQQGHPDGFSGAGERGDPMMHESGGGGKQDEVNLDRERFFRAVDKAITEHCSRVCKLPLVLVALPENQAVFRALSHNPFLLADGVRKDPATLSPAELAQACTAVMSKRYEDSLNTAFDRFGVAVGQRLYASRLVDIEHATLEGRVALLLVEADGSEPGAQVAEEDAALDELILAVIRQGGEVVVVPAERSMPTDTRAAAVLRY
ncbi:hypothetical protein SAMN04490182_4611 [Pseudomonas cedrina]|uniref:Chemotaxis protein n=2 Tax=Pseudomonas cedrina TaxID=651740 RepID=A0A1V2K6P4_PSECE|nr:hypothetical protein [Pseudomonas cedrina]ONH52766.1 hypothetical protein BLL36_17975 [Pseudomonas cedrina subsp. cedrina]SDT43140.1 hypothetical protein SAMN04490182_4611 [Pseudomonas cedrina]